MKFVMDKRQIFLTAATGEFTYKICGKTIIIQ